MPRLFVVWRSQCVVYIACRHSSSLGRRGARCAYVRLTSWTLLSGTDRSSLRLPLGPPRSRELSGLSNVGEHGLKPNIGRYFALTPAYNDETADLILAYASKVRECTKRIHASSPR